MVDRLRAEVLPPGVVTGENGQALSGVWLRVRMADAGDPGPWNWHRDWGDRVTELEDLQRSGEFAFLGPAPYTTAGPHTITVTAADPGGLTSAAAVTTLEIPCTPELEWYCGPPAATAAAARSR